MENIKRWFHCLNSHDTRARDNNVLLTTSAWSIIGPLDKHEDHHVQEQEAQKYDLRDELTVNADASLEVSETKTTELSRIGHTSSLALSWLKTQGHQFIQGFTCGSPHNTASS